MEKSRGGQDSLRISSWMEITTRGNTFAVRGGKRSRVCSALSVFDRGLFFIGEKRSRPWLDCGHSCMAKLESVSTRSRLRRRAARLRFSLGILPVAFQVAIQACASNSQDLRRAQPVALANIQHPLNVNLAQLSQRKGSPIISFRRPRVPLLQMLRQVRQVDEIPARGNAGAGNYVF